MRTLDAERLALAKRIAKHPAPAQVKVDPQAAKRQLIRLSLQKLLNTPAVEAQQYNPTTEQLGEDLLRTVQQMTPPQKAEVRKRLDEALKKGGSYGKTIHGETIN